MSSSKIRGFSPTVALWESRREVQSKIDTMAWMGLHVYNPAWNAAGTQAPGKEVVKANTLYSASFKDCTLKIFGTDLSITIPVQTCTRVGDVKNAIAMRAMVAPDTLTFVIKQGCTWATQLDTAEVGRRVVVKGIRQWDPERHRYPHPTAFIGAGYNGIKHALYWLHHGDKDFVMFDRYERVGGRAWLVQANKTSRLQTEMAAFHVWFGKEWGADNGKLGFPTAWSTWPGTDEVIRHLEHAVERYGILPHVCFKVNVSKIDVVGKPTHIDRSYSLTLQDLKDGSSSNFVASNILHFPGAYFNPRIIDYQGEDAFGGKIGYGMNNDIPFDNLSGKCTAILGNGAFAVENIRTCVEFGASKVYLVTRRRNLALPRLACWFCHQAITPVPAAMLLEMMEPMYELCGWGDPWTYHAVYGTREKSMCTIKSSSRFGIGDVTFLATVTGRCEYVVDLLKRCSPQTLHLVSGRKLENVHNIIKALGLIADFEADRLHHIKEMIGVWPAGDHRRFIFCDPLGMHAANFTTHSTGGASYSSSVSVKHFVDFPFEMRRLKEEVGIDDLLPRMTATEEKPAHQYDAKYAMMCAFTVDSVCPLLQAKMAGMDDYMSELFWAVNPLERYMKECRDSWDRYQEEWKQQGHEFEYVPYPYTMEMVDGWFKEYREKVGPARVSEKAAWMEANVEPSAEPVQYDRGNSQGWWKDSGILRVK